MDTMVTTTIIAVTQAILIVLMAPLMIGVVRKVKAWFQDRRGPPLLQPYLDVFKLFHKESVVSERTSWIFHAAPYVGLASIFVAALMVPLFSTRALGFIGDAIVVVYLLALFRFFLGLAALDAGSAFGGMGSSREMMISAIVEPTMLLSMFTMALITGTLVISDISYSLATTGSDLLHPGLFLAAAAFFFCLLAENARMPFDNPATHLELTMVHEAMTLEYSGKMLGAMELASWGKLVLFAALLSNVFFPWGIATDLTLTSLAVGTIAIAAKVLGVALAIAVIESSMSKMRLFRLPNILTVAFTLALLGVLSYYIL